LLILIHIWCAAWSYRYNAPFYVKVSAPAGTSAAEQTKVGQLIFAARRACGARR